MLNSNNPNRMSILQSKKTDFFPIQSPEANLFVNFFFMKSCVGKSPMG